MGVPSLAKCGRSELAEVSGAGVPVISNLPKCRAPVLKPYRTYRRVGYRYRVRANYTGSVGRVLRPYRPIAVWKIPPGINWYVPYRTKTY